MEANAYHSYILFLWSKSYSYFSHSFPKHSCEIIKFFDSFVRSIIYQPSFIIVVIVWILTVKCLFDPSFLPYVFSNFKLIEVTLPVINSMTWRFYVFSIIEDWRNVLSLSFSLNWKICIQDYRVSWVKSSVNVQVFEDRLPHFLLDGISEISRFNNRDF